MKSINSQRQSSTALRTVAALRSQASDQVVKVVSELESYKWSHTVEKELAGASLTVLGRYEPQIIATAIAARGRLLQRKSRRLDALAVLSYSKTVRHSTFLRR